MDKILKKEYDKKIDRIMLRLSVEERIVLKKMMKDDGWTNVSGFIKYKLFDLQSEKKFKKIAGSTEPSDITLVMQELLDELNAHVGYINYKFNYELNKLEENKPTKPDKKMMKRMSLILDWQDGIRQRTESILDYFENIMKKINIKIERKKLDDIRFVPDEELMKVAKHWDNSMTPEALELARRQYERDPNKLIEY